MRALRLHLDSLAAPDPDTPVVRMIVGDNNLNPRQVREALRRETDDETWWDGFATTADRIGDVVAVCGAIVAMCLLHIRLCAQPRWCCSACFAAVLLSLRRRRNGKCVLWLLSGEQTTSSNVGHA